MRVVDYVVAYPWIAAASNIATLGILAAGALAAWLLALHPWFEKYCAEARGYTLATLLLYAAFFFGSGECGRGLALVGAFRRSPSSLPLGLAGHIGFPRFGQRRHGSPSEQTNFSILVLDLPVGGQTAWRAAKRTMHELAVVLAGTVVFELGQEHKRMTRNDAAYFDLLNRHRWRNVGTANARVLLLNPNFTEVPDTD